MDVTLLIGNGFDLSVGLDTKYRDFLDYYLPIKCKNPVVTEKKRLILTEMKQGIQTWSDMEIALGRFTANFEQNLKGELEFCDLFNDLIEELSSFIFQAQSDAIINATTESDIHHRFKSALQCPYKGLPEENIRIVSKAWREKMDKDQTVRYNFVSYNYSFVFDRCLRRFIKLDPAFTNPIHPKPITYEYRGVTHVHGTHLAAMILGVDSPKQIHNPAFMDESLYCKFVKPIANQNNRRNRETHAHKAIQQSQFVIIYGMSLGSSDDSWWRYLGDWLEQGWERHLIVYYTNTDLKVVWPNGDYEAEKAVKKVFERTMGKKQFQLVSYRIHVALNYPLFPLKLVPKPSA
ncbi:MAG: bacteriophage abortive infection AbiH family protein [Eubacteriales bacterium]|nr:bacteriophage abortive infection AbiH family protein [Eubacteriales bacterium]